MRRSIILAAVAAAALAAAAAVFLSAAKPVEEAALAEVTTEQLTIVDPGDGLYAVTLPRGWQWRVRTKGYIKPAVEIQQGNGAHFGAKGPRVSGDASCTVRINETDTGGYLQTRLNEQVRKMIADEQQKARDRDQITAEILAASEFTVMTHGEIDVGVELKLGRKSKPGDAELGFEAAAWYDLPGMRVMMLCTAAYLTAAGPLAEQARLKELKQIMLSLKPL